MFYLASHFCAASVIYILGAIRCIQSTHLRLVYSIIFLYMEPLPGLKSLSTISRISLKTAGHLEINVFGTYRK